ncbi:MAG TPA: hypothetical protein VF075_07225 [Pyrinomonadaceae bacterium]
MMFSKAIRAIVLAARVLFRSRRALALMVVAYAGLLTSIYLFVSTREATISQLVLTMAVAVVAPALFFLLQAASVSYADGASIRKLATDGLKFIVVSLPVIGLTVLALYGLNKVQSHQTVVTTLRYLLVALVAPLLVIQLWIATSNHGLRSLLRSLRAIVIKTFSPQSVFVYAFGFVIFAVVPFILVELSVQTERAWLELSLLVLRLAVSALLILIGWVMTVGAISILNRD